MFLELVDIQIEWGKAGVHSVYTGQRRHQNLAHQNEPDEIGIDITQPSLRKIHEQDLFLVHDVAEIKRGLFLSDDRTHDVVSRKTSNFEVMYGTMFASDASPPAFAATSVQNCVTIGFLQREILRSRKALLASTRDTSTSVYRFRDLQGQAWWHCGNTAQTSDHLPFSYKKFFKDGEELIHHEYLLLRIARIVFEHVHTHRPLGVGRIKIHHILVAMLGNSREDILYVGTVRIDEAASFAILNILDDHVLEKCGLSPFRSGR